MDDSWEEFRVGMWDCYIGNETNRNCTITIIASFVIYCSYQQHETITHYGQKLASTLCFSLFFFISNLSSALTASAIHRGIAPGAYHSLDDLELEKTQAQAYISRLERELQTARHDVKSSNQSKHILNQQLDAERSAKARLFDRAVFMQDRINMLEANRRPRIGMKYQPPSRIIIIKPFNPDEYDRNRIGGPLQPTTCHPITKKVVTTAQYRSIMEKLESKNITKFKRELANSQVERDDLLKQIKQLQTSQRGLLQKFKKAEKSLQLKSQAITEHETTRTALEDQIREKDATIDELNDTIFENLEETDADGKKFKKQKAELEQTITDLRSQLEQAQARPEHAQEHTSAPNERLEEQLESARGELRQLRESAEAVARSANEHLQQSLEDERRSSLEARNVVEAAARASIEQLQVQNSNLIEQARAASSAHEQVLQLQAEIKCYQARFQEAEVLLAQRLGEAEQLQAQLNSAVNERDNFLREYVKYRDCNADNSRKIIACDQALRGEMQQRQHLAVVCDQQQKTLNEIRSSETDAKREVEKMQEEMKEVTQRLRVGDRAQNDLILARAEIANLKGAGTPSRLQAELRDAQVGRARAEQNCAKAHRELEALKRSKVNLELDKNAMKSEITEAKSSRIHQTQKLVALENEARNAKDQLTKKDQAIQDKEDEMTKRMQQLSMAQHELSEKEKVIGSNMEEYTKKTQEVHITKEKLAEMEEKLTETKGEVCRLQTYKEIRILRDQAIDPSAGSNKTRARKLSPKDDDEESEKEEVTDENGVSIPATPAQPRAVLPVRSTKWNKTNGEKSDERDD